MLSSGLGFLLYRVGDESLEQLECVWNLAVGGVQGTYRSCALRGLQLLFLVYY